MRQRSDDHIAGRNWARVVAACAGGWLVVLLLLALISAAPAFAGFEQVATFATSGEGTSEESGHLQGRLQAASGIAVNYTGAGGVPAGTVYSLTGGFGSGGNEVTRWSPTGEFLEDWGWQVSASNQLEPAQLESCGPDGEAAHPICKENGTEGEGAGQLFRPSAIAVDESTGDVYVRNQPSLEREHNLIEVFSAGGRLITEFVDRSNTSVAESPEAIHGSAYDGGIAVDASGALYISDVNRVMVWRPKTPGDYEHYVYTGLADDIPLEEPGLLQLDSAGNLYSGVGREIEEITPGEAKPKCRLAISDEGAEPIAVDQASGEVFFWDERTPKVVHQLSACNAHGTFVYTGEIHITPKPEGNGMTALGFNPVLAWGGKHPPGALYGGEFSHGFGYIFAPAEVFPPVVESESVSGVTAVSATLGAEIDTKGSNTSYVFQYLTGAAYEANTPTGRFAGAVEVPAGGGVLPAAKEALAAAVTVGGLTPDTEYRFRVVARSHCEPGQPEQVCEAAGEALRLRTFEGGTVGLPDHRAWELVSPVEKQGGEPFPLNPGMGSGAECAAGGCKPGAGTTGFPTQVAPGGEALAYEGFPFSTGEGAPHLDEYLSRRTASGWSTTTLSPALANENGAYDAFSHDLNTGVMLQSTPSLTAGAPSEYENLYLQATADPLSLGELVGVQPPDREAPGFRVEFAGAADDLSRVFFEANDALTGETAFAPAAPDPGAGGWDLYEWSGGQLRLVNVAPGNATVIAGASFGGAFIANIGQPGLPEAVSADGRRVFFSGASGQVYVREDGERTLEVHDPGSFLSASADGSMVLLRDGCLYSLAAEACTDLTGGKGGFEGLVGASNDLSHIYFGDEADLTGEQKNAYGQQAEAGQLNLYSWDEGQLTFIALLEHKGELGRAQRDLSLVPAGREAEASPSGRFLAFVSALPLTGYDNVGPTCVATSDGRYFSGRCLEAFLYDSASGGLVCVSCDPSGAAPLGWTNLPIVGSARSYLPQPRYLTDAGRLVFDSRDALSLLDTNRAVEGLVGEEGSKVEVAADAGLGGAEDVYEYEPQGVGSCGREAGCVALLSGGHEPYDSDFLAMDESGANVFFTTRDRLVPADHDELIDVYDAREGGGFPPPERSVECLGEACQPAPNPAAGATPASSMFLGAGNVQSGGVAKKSGAVKHAQAKPRRRGCGKGRRAVRVRGKTQCMKSPRTARHKHRGAARRARSNRNRKGGHR